MTMSNTPIDHLWDLASQGKVVPVAEIPALQLVSDATRTAMVQSGTIPAIKIGGRWHSDPEVVIAAMRQEHEAHCSTLGKKKHHLRAKSNQGVTAARQAKYEAALAHLQSIGVAPKS